MARRSDHSREELEALFLASARQFAEAEGINGIVARRIAQDVGYAHGTIYNVFGSLDGLILRLRANTLDELFAVCSAVPMKSDAAKNLRRLAAAYTDFVVAHPRLWGVVFEHRLPISETPDWYGEKVLRLLNLVEQAIGMLFPPGNEAARHHEARVLWSSLHGIVSLEVTGRVGAQETVEALTDSLIENYIRGLSVNSIIRADRQ